MLRSARPPRPDAPGGGCVLWFHPARPGAAVGGADDSSPARDRRVPVRLAKRTTNLFRPRAAAAGPGLDVSGLTGVLDVDPAAGTATVQGLSLIHISEPTRPY